MHSYLDRSSKGRALIIFIIGAIILAAGAFTTKVAWHVLSIVYGDYNKGESPYNFASLIYQALWLLVTLCILIVGVSLIRSALQRKEHDLIPGPTLYFLGLGLTVIGGYLILSGLTLEALASIVIGCLLIYWEWAYHVS